MPSGPPINPAPGGKVTNVGADEPCKGCSDYQAEFLTLNGLSLTPPPQGSPWVAPDMLLQMEKMTAQHVLCLRSCVWQAEGVDNNRLQMALEAVWLRNFERPANKSIGMQILETRLADTTGPLSLPYNQADGVKRYMYSKPSAGPPTFYDPPPAPPAGDPFPESALQAWGTAEQTEFKRKVYSAHVALAKGKGRKFVFGLPAEQLAPVAGGQLRVDVAPVFQKLLARAREDLAADQAAGDALANMVVPRGVALGNGYRGATQELSIWEDLFSQYYDATKNERQAASGGEHGPAAVALLAGYYSGNKAAPGFGNHTLGVAVDFVLRTTGGKDGTLTAKHAQDAQWKASWLLRWLTKDDMKNSKEFHFGPYKPEIWHWEYDPKYAPSGS